MNELKITIDNTQYDSFTQWGVGVEPEGWDVLRSFPTMKEPVVNKNVTANGAVVIPSTVGLLEDRSLSVAMFISNKAYSYRTNVVDYWVKIVNGVAYRSINGVPVTSETSGAQPIYKRVLVPKRNIETLKTNFLNAIKGKKLIFTLKQGDTTIATHTFYYISCSNYTQTDGLVKFMLNLYEPNNE